jgi:two-component system sensor histidine kinase UhpB
MKRWIQSRIELLRKRFLSVPLFNRVLIANSLVIVVGAVAGTLLTRQFVLMGNLGLILIHISVGISLSLFVNYVILRSAFRPLQELRRLVDQVKEGQPSIPDSLVREADPDVRSLAAAIDSMLGRLERRRRQLRALSERVIDAHEEERRRIARGLHDDTAQALSMLVIHLERLEKDIPEQQQEIKAGLAHAVELVSTALEDLRKIVFDLRPVMLDDLGMVPAIRWFARSKLEEEGIELEFDLPDDQLRLLPHIEIKLFRISQEAVNNIVSHAQATKVKIGLLREADRIRLMVKDDGRGFDVAQTALDAVRKKRLGLLGIQEQADLVGGEARIESSPNKGTRITVTVPLEAGDVVVLDRNEVQIKEKSESISL